MCLILKGQRTGAQELDSDRLSGVRLGVRSAFPSVMTDIAGVVLSHPERILYPEQGITKQDLAATRQSLPKIR